MLVACPMDFTREAWRRAPWVGYHWIYVTRFPSMLERRTAIAIFALSLAGCAIFSETYGIQEVDNWARRNEPLAESGKMKWSDFYAQYLEKVSATPVIGQSPVVERLGIMITASLFYEQGRLDKAGFDSVQRIVRTYQTIDDPAANMLARNALVRALEH
jgi:hypothetical protein